MGGRYLLGLIGEILLMINEDEDRILRFARLCVSQDREAVIALNALVIYGLAEHADYQP